MSEPRAQGAVNLKCPPCLWSVFLNKTETLSIQYPTLAPVRSERSGGSQIHFPDREVERPRGEEKRELRISYFKAVLLKGLASPVLTTWPSEKGVIQAVAPRLMCHHAPFFPQVVNITDLKGLELGQTFSIQWDLPVSDLQKFNCFPEQPAVSEESCRERGCLWEVRTRNRLPQWAGSCKKCPMGNWVPRKHFPNVDRLNCNHLQEANDAMATDEVFLSVACDRRSTHWLSLSYNHSISNPTLSWTWL